MFFNSTTFSSKNEKGAALITCLTLLVVLTIIGVSSMTSSTMEEKMAGNIRNKHMSFQAAEAALRAGEQTAAGILDGTTFTDPASPSTSSGGLYQRSVSLNPIWSVDSHTTTPIVNTIGWQTSTLTGSTAIADPQYIIEDYGNSPRDSDCMLDLTDATCLLPVYRVTARGWGLNTIGYSIVQSTYKQF